MKKDIKDYLHLYLGQEVYVQKKQGNESMVKGRISEVTSGSNHGDWIEVEFQNVVKFMYYNFDERQSNFHTFFIGEDFIKLILRPLSDMSDAELREFNKLDRQFNRNTNSNTEQMRYCLSKGFDIFDLIHTGLAIDNTDLKKPA